MKKVAVTGGNAGFKEFRAAACAAVVLGIGALSPAWAQQAQPADIVVAQAEAAESAQDPLRLEVQTSTLPRMEALDTGFQAPRVDMTLFPSGRSGLGAVVGMGTMAPRQGLGILPYGLQQRPSLDIGVRWTQRVHNHRIDITAWRRMSPDAYTLVQSREPVYGARVEMNLGSGKKRIFGFDRGLLGLQLQSGARISIKRKNGGPMIYYRTTF